MKFPTVSRLAERLVAGGGKKKI